MNLICPECHLPNDIDNQRSGNRIICKHCKAIFLIPVEIVAQMLREDLDLADKGLEDQFNRDEKILAENYSTASAEIADKRDRAAADQQQVEQDCLGQVVQKPIIKQLLKYVLLVYLIVGLFVNAILMGYQYMLSKDNVENSLQDTEIIFGTGLAEAVWGMDDDALKAVAIGIMKQPVITGILIVDEDGAPLAAGGQFITGQGGLATCPKEICVDSDLDALSLEANGDSAASLLQYVFPILVTDEGGEKKNIGTSTVYSRRGVVLESVITGYVLLAVNTAIIALTMVCTLLLVGRRMLLRPLTVLTNGVGAFNMESLDTLDVDIGVKDRNELKILEESYNTMVGNVIKELKSNVQLTRTFEKFIPKQLLSKIADAGILTINLGGMESECLAVLYGKIETVEALSQIEKRKDKFTLLNELLSVIQQPVEKHGGFLFKFSKTEIIALFDLSDRAMEALSAVYAAIDIQNGVAAFTTKPGAFERASISVSIGIDSAEITLGTIGNENRMESVAMGEAIDTAIKLAELTTHYGSQILISHRVLSQVEGFKSFQWRELDHIQLSADGDPAEIYEVLDADPVRELKENMLDFFHEGLASYRSENWKAAGETFEKCLQAYNLDVATRLYLQRCKSRLFDNEITLFLRNESKLFQQVNIFDDISLLADQFSQQYYEAGKTVISQGEIGTHLYIIFKGAVDIFITKDTQELFKVNQLGSGSSFGEISLLTGDPVTATVITSEPSQLLTLDRQGFEKLIELYPALNRYFHKLVAQYLYKNARQEKQIKAS